MSKCVFRLCCIFFWVKFQFSFTYNRLTLHFHQLLLLVLYTARKTARKHGKLTGDITVNSDPPKDVLNLHFAPKTVIYCVSNCMFCYISNVKLALGDSLTVGSGLTDNGGIPHTLADMIQIL